MSSVNMQAKVTADAAVFVAQLCMATHACILQGLHAQAWYKQASNNNNNNACNTLPVRNRNGARKIMLQ